LGNIFLLVANDQASQVAEAIVHSDPAGWSVIPFITLLVLIATGPLLFEQFWHHHYPKVALFLGALVVSYYLLGLNNFHSPVHAFFEYFQFISLIAALFIASGGILIEIDREGKPLGNTLILFFGAIIANLIGTTGASMLLIRPFLRLNRKRVKPYHVVFFIFIVSNVGGSLTPIGDPPLFLGFLKGVPFFWTLEHNWPAWIIGVVLLCLIFYFFDRRNKSDFFPDEVVGETRQIKVRGKLNFLWLAVIIAAVFIDPNLPGFEWVPYIDYQDNKFSFLRESIMLTVGLLAYFTTKKEILKKNDFNMEPIREVAFIFIGIFSTMMPALEMVGEFAKSPAGIKLLTINTLYWGTGTLSGFLDNAPTYLNFLAAALSSNGGDINSFPHVHGFAMGSFVDSIIQLKAISIAAVFFGALTYIGNGPNFMVKSIAEQVGISMPSFFGYIIRFSIPFLIPVLFLVWLFFF
jgi:Na+/H+ antiporter NhaD/arsenite permease-like protein